MPKSVEARISALEKKRGEVDRPRGYSLLQLLQLARGYSDDQVGPPSETLKPGELSLEEIIASMHRRPFEAAPA